jgi:uncharacterized protein involved in outer membrane biogenesis
MKKLFIGAVVAVVVLVVAVVIGIGLMLDKAIVKGVETVGPMVTKTSVKLDSASLSILSGGGKLNGLVVGNPEGYKTPSAISVGKASLAVKPGSVLSDKIIVRSVVVEAPEITFETDLRANNLSKILANVKSTTGGDKESKPTGDKQPAGPGKKLQVDEFILTGGKVHVSLTVMGGKSVTVPLPEIRLKDLGTGPEGITPAELTSLVLKAVLENAEKVASTAASDLAKNVMDMTKDLNSSNAVDKVSKGIGDLFKKKK